VHLHNCKDKDGETCSKGSTTFGELGKDKNGQPVYLFQIAKVYDYVDDDGYNNLSSWIEDAA